MIDDLRAYLARRDDAEPAVAPGMRSYVLAGDGPHAIVLVHGLTASPHAWSGVARALNERGATVVAVRLPLHGYGDRMTTALRGLTADVLTADLEDVLERVAALGKRVTVAGHSLGGTLATAAAAHSPYVERIVAVAPFTGISFVPYELHAPLLALMRVVPNVYLWWDPVLRERQIPARGYPRYPLGALYAGMHIAEGVYRTAHGGARARAIDLVLNDSESSVNNRTAERLARRWRAAGASVALHRLRGLPRSHDIIEPERHCGPIVLPALVGIIGGEHAPGDYVRRLP